MLKPQNSVPLEIKVKDLSGKEVSLNGLLDKYVILYFYPKDFTSGCTTEANAFQAILPDLKELKVELIGVSKDTVDSHKRFSKKNDLNFQLWADPEHKLIEAFGVWGKKKFIDRFYMGTVRTTFVINPKGKIIKTWEEVKPADHAKEVLDFVKTISEIT